jgi:AAA-like domain/CHAT domain
MKKVLILAANPFQTVQLRLNKEVEEIRITLQLSGNREQFEIESRGAVSPDDLQEYLINIQPQIVHFSGHGIGGIAPEEDIATRKFVNKDANLPLSGLVFEDEMGQSQVVSGEALAKLFKLFNNHVECVLLNACYSEVQAQAIVQYIPYVIGMNQAIGDEAARQFAQGFYRAIWANRSIEDAFALGVNAIELQGKKMPEGLTPVLIRRSDLTPASDLSNQDTSINLENPEGAVGIDSKFYIHSVHEDRCYREVQKPASLIRIKSPCNMGKSSLMVRLLNQVEQLGYHAVMLDLRQANQKFFNDPDQFMRWFCASVGKSLGIRVEIDQYWDDDLGANDNSTEYFEKYLLEGAKKPLVLAIDNFDRVFEYPDLETDFCGLLRGWHENAKVKDLWNNLRLIIVHSQEPYAQRDINLSPFNVGWAIELDEFTPVQVQELITLHRLNWTEQEKGQLMSLIGGHPYLTRMALYHLAVGDVTFVDFMTTAATEAGIYSDHLTRYLNVLEKYPLLATAMKTVVMSEIPIQLRSQEAFKLDGMGLIMRVENKVQSRCLLYSKYFRERLGN